MINNSKDWKKYGYLYVHSKWEIPELQEFRDENTFESTAIYYTDKANDYREEDWILISCKSNTISLEDSNDDQEELRPPKNKSEESLIKEECKILGQK